ncbi:DNA repair protein RecO [Candidatus Parcubacteria bacterium]|nr:MAG: DNA repair protein RecO [Candidatus Parcubacteria bacterium]
MLAIVLSRRDFRESDQIISLYTLEKGKLDLLARGVKKITSKNSAHLEPFSVVDIDIAYGKELDHLTKVQPVEYFKHIRTNLQKSLAAQIVVSVTDKFVHVEEVDERVFVALQSWLEFLNDTSVISSFKLLLDGYMVVFLHCLGFTITEDQKMNRWVQALTILQSGEWEAVNELEYDPVIHQKIYHFFVYQTEKKVLDWAKLA